MLFSQTTAISHSGFAKMEDGELVVEYSNGEETEEDDNADVDEASTVEGNIVGAEDPKDVGAVEQTAVEETEEDDNADVVEPSVEVNIFGAEDPTNFGVVEPMAVALSSSNSKFA
jgi:hypothetical protein